MDHASPGSEASRASPGTPGVIRRLVRAGLLLYAATVVAVAAAAWAHARAYPPAALEPVDALIVLGGGVDPDGQIAYSTRRRVRAAADALDAGKADVLILSGGAPPGHEPDAVRMARFARGLGIHPEAIVIEDRARTTFQNLPFSFALAEARGFDRVALVTDSYHLSRAVLLARWFGRPGIPRVAATGLGRDAWHQQAHALGREALAWWYNLGKVALWEILGLAGVSENARAGLIR